jgi:16S rRNA (adenine1518-N6/adenine1519-N6)-dimethyltransferase
MTSRTRQRIDPSIVRATLREAGLRARPDLSQHFLADPDVLEDLLAAASPTPGRRIVEIGPGLGILTGALLDAGASVTAIELDGGLVRWLRGRFATALAAADRPATDAHGPADAPGRLRLIEGDALDLDLAATIEPPYDVVANLPYHVTSPVLHRLLDGGAPRPERAVLMVQREVAERIAAPPGGLSYLAVFCQYHARIRIARLVEPAAFEPAPAVWSAVVVVEPWRAGDADAPVRLAPADEEALWRLVQAAFRERRKMVHNVLRRQLPLPADRIDAALAAVGIAPDRRPQTVSVAEWMGLLEAIGPIEPDARGRRRDERARRDERERRDESERAG